MGRVLYHERSDVLGRDFFVETDANGFLTVTIQRGAAEVMCFYFTAEEWEEMAEQVGKAIEEPQPPPSGEGGA